MGDRVLVQVVSSKEFSPVAYGHWYGSYIAGALHRLKARMANRPGDVPYIFARLIQEMTEGDAKALSFGAWNADKELTADDSHGDAGVVIVDVSNGFKCKCLGGYLEVGSDGMVKGSK